MLHVVRMGFGFIMKKFKQAKKKGGSDSFKGALLLL